MPPKSFQSLDSGLKRNTLNGSISKTFSSPSSPVHLSTSGSETIASSFLISSSTSFDSSSPPSSPAAAAAGAPNDAGAVNDKPPCLLSSFREALAKGLFMDAADIDEPDAANGFTPKLELDPNGFVPKLDAPPKGLEEKGDAADDDAGMANEFDEVEKGLEAKGLMGAAAEDEGAAVGAGELWTGDAVGGAAAEGAGAGAGELLTGDAVGGAAVGGAGAGEVLTGETAGASTGELLTGEAVGAGAAAGAADLAKGF
jgi:hypothetical protein